MSEYPNTETVSVPAAVSQEAMDALRAAMDFAQYVRDLHNGSLATDDDRRKAIAAMGAMVSAMRRFLTALEG